MKQCGRVKKNKRSHNLGYGDRLFEEEIGKYEARTADRCKIGKDCCHLWMLEVQPDFLQEKSMLETVIKAAGHEVIFYPKFHCKTNYIEYYWGAVKRYTQTNCWYSFPELEKTLYTAFDSVGLQTIRRFANQSKRWIMAYINGVTVEQHEYAEKQYKSHRRTDRNVFI